MEVPRHRQLILKNPTLALDLIRIRHLADASSHRKISDSVPLVASSVMMSLSVAGQAIADEAIDAVVEAAPSGGLPFGLTPGEIVLLITPLAGFAIFKGVVQPKVGGTHAAQHEQISEGPHLPFHADNPDMQR